MKDKIFKCLKNVGTVAIPLYFYMNGIQILSCIGIGLFIFFLGQFFVNIGKKIDLRDTIILVAIIQWVIGAICSYAFVTDNIFFYMRIPEEKYMEYIIPGTILYALGLFFPLKYSTEIKKEDLKGAIEEELCKYPNLDVILLLIGFISSYIAYLFPYSLRFLFHLISLLKFVGLFYILFSNRAHKWLYCFIVIGSLVVGSVSRGMFHDFILWGLFIFLIAACIRSFSYRKKILITIIGFLGIATIQLTKNEYRKIIWFEEGHTQTEKILVYSNIVYGKYNTTFHQIISESEKNVFISRVNQGWIISMILNYVPKKEPFANGETIIRTIKDSLLPRFLNPGKLKSGGHEYFERFTGRKLAKTTSMGLSSIGEAYANFGYYGGIFFMFIFGLFYNFIVKLFFKIAEKSPTIIFWMPVIFLYSIKAESDLFPVLNYLVKGSFFVVVCLWLIRKYYGLLFKPKAYG